MIRSETDSKPRRAARGRARRWLGAGALAALAMSSFAAHAQPTPAERAQAEALFNEAKKLLKEGKTSEACRKLEGSYRIDPAGGTVLNLGLCHEKEGKIASAWAEMKEALALAKKANRKDREKIARERIEALEPRLPYMLVIPDKPDMTGLAVLVDEGTIEREAWGAQIPVDPGTHTVKATAPGYDAWEGPFEAAEGKKVTVRVPPLKRAAPVVTASAGATSAPSAPVVKFPWMRPSGIAIASVGLAAVAVGAAFGVSALSLGGKARSECDASFACSDAGLAAVQDGRTSATAADILLGAGGGFTAVGLVFIIAGGMTQPASAEGATTGARGPTNGARHGDGARGAATAGVKLTPLARVSTSGAVLGLEGAW